MLITLYVICNSTVTQFVMVPEVNHGYTLKHQLHKNTHQHTHFKHN